jgi:hypothetical protein
MNNSRNILKSTYWKNTDTFKAIKNKENQLKYYKKHNSTEEICQLVELESKPFGIICENIIIELFNINHMSSTQNDGIFNGKKIEIKTARYWANKDDCRWQHLEKDHDYEYVLFVLLDFTEFKIWCIKKSLLMGELITKKIVTNQGKQGWWTKKSKILPYLNEINSIIDLEKFIQ